MLRVSEKPGIDFKLGSFYIKEPFLFVQVHSSDLVKNAKNYYCDLHPASCLTDVNSVYPEFSEVIYHGSTVTTFPRNSNDSQYP